MYTPRTVLALLAALLPGVALAGPPGLVPMQGRLLDALGDPLAGSQPVQFTLYDASAGGRALWTESQTVEFQGGIFAVHLGADTPLDLELFAENREVWVGIQVDAAPEMNRLRLGNIPYAAYAEYTTSAQTLGGQTREEITAALTADFDSAIAAALEAGLPTPADIEAIAQGVCFDSEAELLAALGDDFLAASWRPTWGDLTGIPTDLADGDADTTYSAGAGLSLTGTQFSVDAVALQNLVNTQLSSSDAFVAKTNGTAAGLTTTGTLTTDGVRVITPDTAVARIALHGTTQGTGDVYVGQSATFGAGFYYNGDDNPDLLGVADDVVFYRRDNGVDFAVMRYRYNSGDIYVTDSLYTGSTVVAGAVGTAANTAVRALAANSHVASLEAYGPDQGSGRVYVGQSATFGAGFYYNGDDTPDLLGVADDVVFFRRDNNVDHGVMRYRYNSGDVFFSDNIDIGSDRPAANHTLSVRADDNHIATVNAMGTGTQGSGMFYAGQSTVYGGGFFYNGDNSPTMPGRTDYITFFRRDNGTDAQVFDYAYNSNTVGFYGSFGAASDARLKHDIQPLRGGLDAVLALDGVTWQWNDPGRGKGLQQGFIAQQVQQVAPHLVFAGGDGTLMVNYNGVIPLLVESTHELVAARDDLQQELAVVKAKNAELQEEIDDLHALTRGLAQRLDALESRPAKR